MKVPGPTIEQPPAGGLPISAVLGISGAGGKQWARLRGLQYAQVAKVTFYRAYGHLILALLIAQIFISKVAPLWLGSWLVALFVTQIRSAVIDRRNATRRRPDVGWGELLRHTTTAFVSGVLWSVPILVFAPLGGISDLVAVLFTLAILVGASVFFFTTTPISLLVFTAVIAMSAVSHLAMLGLWPAAAAVALFLVTVCLGTVEIGRIHLTARLAEERVAEKEQVVSLLLREFEENEADWLWEIDTNRKIRSVSPRFAFALEASQDEVEGQPLLDLLGAQHWKHGQFPPSLHDLAERLRNREHFSTLLVQVVIKGAERWWELSGSPMRDEQGRFIGFRGVGSDVTEQRESSEKIAYLARYDTLTALPNRLMLTETLADALELSHKWRTRCALLMVDLDRFKAVNDSLGHMTGDRLLAQVSARLESLMTDNAMVGRLGGDEFAIVIRDANDREFLDNLAQALIRSLSEPYQVDNHTLYVGASVGSAIGPRDGKSVEELMRNADLALYSAKDAGGGEHCRFEPSLHALAEERRKLEASLRKALGLDEFILHYQPVVDARSENIVSFEALVRWNSVEHGFVSPGKFIPLAEDTRLIVPIGRWVLRQACHEAANWPEHIKVNVNVSPEQLLEPDFDTEVVSALTASGLRAERLEVEVTESIFLRDASIARAALEKILALGCSVALDDFGTGYSSLGYLRKLRFSTIKVDRTFVQGAAQGSNESLAIINAVVAMAKSMKMTTTAEGVESSEEAELIRNLGCDKIQGFYFGRPMASADARRLFQPAKIPPGVFRELRKSA
ncbi:MAG: EAL domain-containing protein [Erythrobacter sp.]